MKAALAALALTTASAVTPVAAEPSPAAAVYQSTTAAYTPYREESVAGWRAANDEMARLNGHIGHVGGHIGGRQDTPRVHEGAHPPRPGGETTGHHPGKGGHHE